MIGLRQHEIHRNNEIYRYIETFQLIPPLQHHVNDPIVLSRHIVISTIHNYEISLYSKHQYIDQKWTY